MTSNALFHLQFLDAEPRAKNSQHTVTYESPSRYKYLTKLIK